MFEEISYIFSLLIGITYIVVSGVYFDESAAGDVKLLLFLQNLFFGISVLSTSTGKLISIYKYNFSPIGWYCISVPFLFASTLIGGIALMNGNGIKTHSVLGIFGFVMVSAYIALGVFSVIWGCIYCLCCWKVTEKKDTYSIMSGLNIEETLNGIEKLTRLQKQMGVHSIDSLETLLKQYQRNRNIV